MCRAYFSLFGRERQGLDRDAPQLRQVVAVAPVARQTVTSGHRLRPAVFPLKKQDLRRPARNGPWDAETGRVTESNGAMIHPCNHRNATPLTTALFIRAAMLGRDAAGRLKGLASDVRGQDQVEYGVFIGLMALAAALSLTELADSITEAYSRLDEVLKAAKDNCANPNPGQYQGRSPCGL